MSLASATAVAPTSMSSASTAILSAIGQTLSGGTVRSGATAQPYGLAHLVGRHRRTSVGRLRRRQGDHGTSALPRRDARYGAQSLLRTTRTDSAPSRRNRAAAAILGS